MRILKTLIIAPVALVAGLQAVSAAGITVSDSADWPVVTYHCAGGETLDVRYSADGDYATIDQMDERILMKNVPSGSGARYAAMDRDYSYALDTKGDDATLYEAGDKVVLQDCVAAD